LVTGPKEIYSLIDDIAIPPDPPEGGWSLYVTTTIPTDAPSGTYTLRVTMTINGQSSTKESSFTVLGGSEQPPAAISRIPEGKAPNLVVLVHGCCTFANHVIEIWDSLGKAIADTIIQNPPPERWEIVVLDWHEDTSDLNFFGAYKKAVNRGHNLANAIADHRYNYVHLIGHSAGANLIDTVATDLLLKSVEAGNKPFIHLTFLDAYTPENNELFYGRSADYAEHYVDRGLLFTDGCLDNAFNFDITNWTPGRDDRLLPVPEYGHQWPHRWYKKSVAPTFISGYKYGYPLSLEGSGKNLNELINDLAQYPDGQQCSLVDIGTSCIPVPCW
jgi:hypothetical protein